MKILLLATEYFVQYSVQNRKGGWWLHMGQLAWTYNSEVDAKVNNKNIVERFIKH